VKQQTDNRRRHWCVVEWAAPNRVIPRFTAVALLRDDPLLEWSAADQWISGLSLARERPGGRVRAERQADLLNRALPAVGGPRWIRIYDNGDTTADRYTVVFANKGPGRMPLGHVMYLGMSAAPFHPQGFCQHGESKEPIDWPRYGHLGRKIGWDDLPTDCQRAVLNDYRAIWYLATLPDKVPSVVPACF